MNSYLKIKLLLWILLVLTLFCFNDQLFASEIIEFKDRNQLLNIGGSISILEDKSGVLTIQDVINKKFKPSTSSVPNLKLSKSTFWVKFSIKNLTNENDLILNLSLTTIDDVTLYSQHENGFKKEFMGEIYPFHQRKYFDPDYLFDIDISMGETKNYYLQVQAKEGIQLPLKLGKKDIVFEQIKKRDILSGIYIGIMLVMILYNLFIYFSVRDKSYIYYVVYILIVLLTQSSLQGYPFQYLWPNYPIIAQYSLLVFPAAAGISGMYFMLVFLKVKEYNIFLYRISFALTCIYLLSIIYGGTQYYSLSQMILQINAMVVSIYMLVIPIIILRKGYQPAKYFLIAWVVFLMGVIGFVLKDMGALPFNNFTRYTMQIGSAIETVLLSFALAARINIYKKEKEESQAKMLVALQANEKIITNQKKLLEKEVKARTSDLNKTLNHLKKTQTELVEAEKMSSLGQLSAGIAHEINNSINFVSSNILPLKHNVQDVFTITRKYEELENSTDNVQEKLNEIKILKEELEYNYLKTELPEIINGIENGANRTIEIVNGLKNFSRLDEEAFKVADINVGIKSTLLILRSKLGAINVNLELGNFPQFECNPGKLNQVILNLLDNAIFAIKERVKGREEEGIITIKTEAVNQSIEISISDNGIGIPKQNQLKLFEPFYTTKDVGEGTGLGLSIVKGIIDSHKGSINVISKENQGTEFIIKIPKKK